MDVGFPFQTGDIVDDFLFLHNQAQIPEAAEAPDVGGVVAIEDHTVQSAGPVFQQALGILYFSCDLGTAAAVDIRSIHNFGGGEQRVLRTDQPCHGNFLPVRMMTRSETP